MAVNAAAIESETAPLHECDEAVFDRMQSINVRGLFLCMKHELRAMLAQGRGGAIVNIASTNSFRPQHEPARLHRVEARRDRAHPLGRVRLRGPRHPCQRDLPGRDRHPDAARRDQRRGRDPQDVADRLSMFGRFGRPEEIAAGALWLCSEGSSFTTGHPLAIDAGYLAR